MSEWLSGRRVVREILRGSNREIDSIWVEKGATGQVLDEIRLAAEIRGVEFREVEAAEFAGLEALVEHIGQVAQAVQTYRPEPGGNAPAVFG